jgi:hypothetical protein
VGGLILLVPPAFGQPRERDGRDGDRVAKEQAPSREQVLERQVRELQEQLRHMKEMLEKSARRPDVAPQPKPEAAQPPKPKPRIEAPMARREDDGRDRDGLRGPGWGPGFGGRGQCGRFGPPCMQGQGRQGWQGPRGWAWRGEAGAWGRGPSGRGQGMWARPTPPFQRPQAGPDDRRLGPPGDVVAQVRQLMEDARRLLAKAEQLQQLLQRGGPGGPERGPMFNRGMGPGGPERGPMFDRGMGPGGPERERGPGEHERGPMGPPR